MYLRTGPFPAAYKIQDTFLIINLLHLLEWFVICSRAKASCTQGETMLESPVFAYYKPFVSTWNIYHAFSYHG